MRTRRGARKNVTRRGGGKGTNKKMHKGAKTKKTKQKLHQKKIVRYIEKRLKQLQKNHPDPYVPDSPEKSIDGNSSKELMNTEVNPSVPGDSSVAAKAPEGAQAPEAAKGPQGAQAPPAPHAGVSSPPVVPFSTSFNPSKHTKSNPFNFEAIAKALEYPHSHTGMNNSASKSNGSKSRRGI